MRITILTLFPEMFDGFLTNSIIKRAIANKIVEVNLVNIRDYTKDKYRRVDTPPIGGGAGLIMKCQPIVDALKDVQKPSSHKILLSPKGKKFHQQIAINYAKLDDLIIVCGHYEGIDARVSNYVDEEISIGDYVLTGGEIGAMAISDAVIRLLDGAISDASLDEETFSDHLLEYPQYTEPDNFEGHQVPNILYTGNHQAIEKYRRKEALRLTRDCRPDLFKKHLLTKQDQKLLREIIEGEDKPKWYTDALKKGQKFTK